MYIFLEDTNLKRVVYFYVAFYLFEVEIFLGNLLLNDNYKDDKESKMKQCI